MDLAKRWGRLLATYSGRSWVNLTAYSYGDGRLHLDAWDWRGGVVIEVKPDHGPVWEMVEAMHAKFNSVPAYALSDALRENRPDGDYAEQMADMLAATVA